MVDSTIRALSRAPQNREAAMAFGKGGVRFDAKDTNSTYRWAERPLMAPQSAIAAIAPEHNMLGRVKGRLEVIGLLAKEAKGVKASWIVRCKCGYYETRRAKSLKADNGDDRCGACTYLIRMERRRQAEMKGRWADGTPYTDPAAITYERVK